MHIANKLLGRQRLNFEQLTTPEQNLWSLFEKSDIFEFLTGQKDTVPQFENFYTFGAAPKVNINIQKIAQNLHPILPTQNHTPIHSHFWPYSNITLSSWKKGKNWLQSPTPWSPNPKRR